MKTVTEGTRGYSQIMVLKNTAKALSAYVDVVIERMKGQNGPKTISFGIRVRSASKDWTFYPSFAEYDSFIEYSQAIPIKLHAMWFPVGNVRDTLTSEWDEWNALLKSKPRHEDSKRKQYQNFLKGKNGCKQNLKEAARVNSKLADEGDQTARWREFEGRLKGKGAYKLNPNKAVKRNSNWAEKGDQVARERQFYGLLNGKDGYKRIPQRAVSLNTAWVDEGDFEARKREFDGHYNDTNGYLFNIKEAFARNMKWAQEGDQAARERHFEKLDELRKNFESFKIRHYQHETELKEVIELNRTWVIEGDREAKKREIHMYLYGKYNIPCNPEEGYRLMRKWRVLP